MEGKGAASAIQLRHRDAYNTPALSKPPGEAVTVSAAAVFTNRKLDTPQNRTDTRSLQKSTAKVNRNVQKEKLHPIAMDLKSLAASFPVKRAGLIVCSRN